MRPEQTTEPLAIAVADTPQGRRLAVSGPLTNLTARRLDDAVAHCLQRGARKQSAIEINLSGLTALDTAGVATLLAAIRQARDRGAPLRIAAMPERHQRLFALVSPRTVLTMDTVRSRKPPGVLEKLGEAAVVVWRDMRAFLDFVGGVNVEALRSALRPRRVRWSETLYYLERTGVDAIPIVFLVALLMGLILGFQAAIQLRQFGANIFVADLVGVSITRELGPLMTAIIVAGRSGSAFAAEIGTMKVSEEIAALEVMGFDPMRFLVMPKLLALVVALPCLSLFADAVGLSGGLMVGILQLDLSITHYLEETRIAVSASDIASGLLKSAVFAILIAGIGCFRGLQVSLDAESVGRLTTSAVVSAIFLVIACDAAFTVLFFALGI
ncbi:MAG: MlaE family lipid ABC transporter permease subunit [Candidatus Schekmanbacteria bacterium]|nr:MlaE family lipid ABC transporter permease subunit [Candidatus Schekmanbacteria bacterium]